MSEQDKLINRLEGDVELRDQNIAELCEDFTSALAAFRALSQRWREEADGFIVIGKDWAQKRNAVFANGCFESATEVRSCADELDALLVSLSAPEKE